MAPQSPLLSGDIILARQGFAIEIARSVKIYVDMDIFMTVHTVVVQPSTTSTCQIQPGEIPMKRIFDPTTFKPVSRRSLLQLGALGAATLAAPTLLGRRAFAAGPELRTAEPGVLTMATTGDMPMVAIREGNVIGADADALALIAERLGLKIKADVMEWSACLASVPAGRADWVGGNTAWTEQRSKAMLLTDELYFTGIYVAMKKEMAFDKAITIADFAGHSVGTGTGFSFVPDLRKVPGTTEVKLYDTIDAAIRDVVAGRLDFAIVDAPIVDYMILQNPSWELKQVLLTPDANYPVIGSTQLSIWGMNPTNTDLFDAVNQGVAWLWRTNQIGPILAKYGLANPSYLEKVAKSPRIGVDRDEKGNVTGPFAHKAKDFSAYFA